MKFAQLLIALGLLGLAAAAANDRALLQTQSPVAAAAEALVAIATATGTTTTYPIGGKEGKDFPRLVGPTFKFAYKDGIGAFQGWNGGLELPKVIDLGGVRSTRPGLRGRKLAQTQSPVAAAAEALVAIATATGTTTTYPIGGKEGKDFPRLVGPTFKFAYKDGIGAFQGWNGGLELPKVIDLGGVRSTRPGLRGRKLAQTQSPVAAAAEALVALATATGTTTTYPIGGKEGKDFPRLVGPTFKFAYKDGIGAFQGWNGGLELPKVIDLGGVRSTRPGLRGKKMH